MRVPCLLVLLCAAIAFAAAPPRKVTIKKRNGEIVRGTVVSEMDTGYLIKLERGGKAVPVKYSDVADFAEGEEPGAALPPPPPPPPASGAGVAAPPPPPPYVEPPPPAGPCASNEVYVAFAEHDDVTGAVCAGRTEVTMAEYQTCVNARGCTADELKCGAAANWGLSDRGNHPINCVNARQAEAFCAWQKARLPSLLEFQALARRADGEGDFPWGGADPKGDRACWSGDKDRRGTCAAGSYPRGAGRAGIVDIVGNVWEWTSTELRRDRVFAGGAWNDSRSGRIETTSVNRNSADVHYDDVGFRCVRTVR